MVSEDYIDEEKHKIIKEINRIIDSFREDELGISVSIKSNYRYYDFNIDRQMRHVLEGDCVSFYNTKNKKCITINTDSEMKSNSIPCLCADGVNIDLIIVYNSITNLERFIITELIINTNE